MIYEGFVYIVLRARVRIAMMIIAYRNISFHRFYLSQFIFMHLSRKFIVTLNAFHLSDNKRLQTTTNGFQFSQNKCKVRPTNISNMHSIVVCISYNYKDVKCRAPWRKVPLQEKPKTLKEISEIGTPVSKIKSLSYSESSRKSYI